MIQSQQKSTWSTSIINDIRDDIDSYFDRCFKDDFHHMEETTREDLYDNNITQKNSKEFRFMVLDFLLYFNWEEYQEYFLPRLDIDDYSPFIHEIGDLFEEKLRSLFDKYWTKLPF